MVAAVVVVGGGVNGVGAALAIQDAVPEVKVTIVSAELTPDTTGDGSAGIWGPRTVEGPHEKIISWGRRTHDFLEELWRSGDCPGVGVVPAYDVADRLGDPYWWSVPFSYAPMTEKTLKFFGHDGKEGFQYVTIYAMPSKMLPFLMKKFEARGGQVVKAKIDNLDEIPVPFDVIVNCTGIGAHDLVKDSNVTPVRGQVVKVTAPTSMCAKFNFPGTYIIPNDEVVVLGGSATKGDWRREVDPAETERILSRCRSWVPALSAARTERVWAGLRPFREGGVRLETELRQVRGRSVPVVHNYGHGGSGVTLFWGCALDVAQLVKVEVDGVKKRAPLSKL